MQCNTIAYHIAIRTSHNTGFTFPPIAYTLYIVKDEKYMPVRLSGKARDEFKAACQQGGVKQAEAIRQLCAAAVLYVGKYGKWYPPVICPENPEEQNVPPQLRMVAEQVGVYGKSGSQGIAVSQRAVGTAKGVRYQPRRKKAG